MRLFAAAALAGLAIVSVAQAGVWSDPAGRVTFDAPNGWVTTQERGAREGENYTYVVSGTANNECQIIVQPNPGTAQSSAAAAKATALDDTQFGADFWTRVANGTPSVFRDNSAQFLSRSVDTEGFWPIQRAEIQSQERLVHASFQIRPGFNLTTFCMTYDGADPVDLYTRVSRSVGHPNDAAWRVEAEAAAQAAVAPAPEPAPEPEQRQRRR